MEIIDATVSIRPGMVTYPGDPAVRLERVSSIADGAVANLSRLDFGVHSGTHVDAPLHFVDGGTSAESLPLDEAALAELELRGDRILFKTRNSELWARDDFADDFVSLTADGAAFLLARGVRLVGIDYLSIGDEAAHLALLGAGVVTIEGLDLRQVEPGEYELICAPLKLVGSDGAPARVLLLR